jgi:hypothetical protein
LGDIRLRLRKVSGSVFQAQGTDKIPKGWQNVAPRLRQGMMTMAKSNPEAMGIERFSVVIEGVVDRTWKGDVA